MESVKFIVKRLAYSVVVLIGLSILMFSIARVVPGDPARMALGPRAPEWAVQRLRDEMHLEDPVYVQYYYWVKGALHGDLGKSLVTRRSVAHDIREFFPASLEWRHLSDPTSQFVDPNDVFEMLVDELKALE